MIARRTWFRHLLQLLRLALGVALLQLVVSATGGWRAASQFVTVWWLLPLVAAAPFLGAAVEATRLRILFSAQGGELTARRAYQLVAVGTLFNFAIPGGTGGDVMKLYYLAADNRGKGVEVATLLLVDRVVALGSLLLTLLVIAALSTDTVGTYDVIRVLVSLTFVVVVLLLGAVAVSWSDTLRRTRFYDFLITRSPGRVTLRRISDSLYDYRNHPRAIALAIGLSAIGHVMLVALFIAVGSVLVPAASAGTTALLTLLGMFANVIPITPGGLGVGEAAVDRLFTLLGYSGGALVLLAWRLGMIPLSIVGFVWYVGGLSHSKHHATSMVETSA